MNTDIVQWLNNQPPAVSGYSGHSQTFKVACKLFEKFSLSPTEGFKYLNFYNKRCQPPWSIKELKHKIEDSYAKVNHLKQESRPYNKADYGTQEWLDLRAEVIKRAGGICEMCGKTRAETGHHLTYRFGVLCSVKYLLAVCWDCHQDVHG